MTSQGWNKKVHRVPKDSSPEEEQEPMRCSDKSDPLKILLRDKSKSQLTIIAKKIEKKNQFHEKTLQQK